METKKEIRLSSKWTNFYIYFELIVILIGGCFFFFRSIQNEFEDWMLIIGVQFLLFTAFFMYQLIYACEARVTNDKLVLKKLFRPSKSYSFEKIGNLRSFYTYTLVKMENDYKVLEKYVIMNKADFWVSEKKDPKQILISLRDTAK